MKMIKALTLTAALLLSAVSAHAATVWNTYSNGAGIYDVARARVVSGTTPALLGPISANGKQNVTVYLKGSAIASATVSRILSDSTVLDSQAVAVGTTTTSLTYVAPLPFEGILISVTTALTGTNNVSATVIRTR